VVEQSPYSLVDRRVERELLPMARTYGIGITVWSPLAGGLLTGKYRKNQGPPAGSRFDKWTERYKSFDRERNWKIVEALVSIAQEVGRPASQVALSWLLYRPAVSSVIFGARTVAQLTENLEAADLTLSEQALVASEAVQIGGVEVRDAKLDGAMQGSEAFIRLGGAVDIGHPYATEANSGAAKTLSTEYAFLHCGILH